MQNTLLGIGIALILVLTAALVGPYFVNWNSHRAFFEAEATRLVGLPVQVSGAIDARLLPTPSITLRAITIGERGEPPPLRAAALSFQLGLGPLMRGEIKAVETRLIGPELKLGLNHDGSLNWPGAAPRLLSATVAIDRLSIEQGRAILTDAASGTRLVLDRLQFKGTARSLSGPFRGEGSFVIGESGYYYRISTGRHAQDGVRLKLDLEAGGGALQAEADGTLAFDYGAPRFDGTLTLLRPVSAVRSGDKVTVSEPWRATCKVKASVTGAFFEQIDFRYGPEERAVTLTGAAEAKFGEQSSLHGNFSARHIDLDRLMAKPGVGRQLPFAVFKNFVDVFAAVSTMSVSFNLKVDSVMLGGAMVQSVIGDLRADRDGWMVEPLRFRAPGFAQVEATGRLVPMGGFRGAIRVSAADSATLLAWVSGQGQPNPGSLRPWRLEADVTLGGDQIVFDRFKTELDRAAVGGRLAYTFRRSDRPARFFAELRATDVDVDAWLHLADAIPAGWALERPQEIELSFNVDKARIAGIDTGNASVKVKLDGDRLDIEQFSVAALGNASFEIRGRIEAGDGSPRGEIDLKLDAQELKGILALTEQFMPALAPPLRRLAGEHAAAQLRGKLGVEGSSPGALTKRTTARLRLDGQIGAFRLQLAGASTASGAMSLHDFAAFAAGELKFEGQLDTDDGHALLALFGFDRPQLSEKRPGRLRLLASGPLSRNFRVDVRLISGPFDLSGGGTANLTGERPAASFGRVSGVIGGSKVEGRLALVFDAPLRLDGALTVDQIDVPVAVASLIGMPMERMTTGGGGTGTWSTEPFPTVLFGFAGRIEIRAARARLTARHTVQSLRGALQFTSSRVSFEVSDGDLAGGRFKGNIALFSGLDGLSALTYLELNDARAIDVIPAEGRGPINGNLSIKATVEGAGLTPAAFLGSLQGNGEVTISKAEFSGLNPGVFDALTRVVDLGVKSDPTQIREFVAILFTDGHLSVPQAHSKIVFVGGQARLVEPRVEAVGAELAVSAMVDLVKANLDATLRLSGSPAGDVAGRPAVTVVLRGPIGAPQRTINTESLAGWLALRAVEQQTRRIEAFEAARRAALTQPFAAVVPTAVAPTAVAPVVGAPVSFAPAVSAREDDDANATASSAPAEAAATPAESATVVEAEQAPPPLPPPIIIAPDPVPPNPARAAPKRGSFARP